MPASSPSPGNASDQRGAVLRHVADSGAQLASLVRRIVDKDRDGIIGLHDVLWARVVHDLLAVLPDPADADAVATATFVEIWLLARFHSDPDADVCVWIDGILARRVAERVQIGNSGSCNDGGSSILDRGDSWVALAKEHDRLTTLALAALLGNPARGVRI